jgi:hypothetical protein
MIPSKLASIAVPAGMSPLKLGNIQISVGIIPRPWGMIPRPRGVFQVPVAMVPSSGGMLQILGGMLPEPGAVARGGSLWFHCRNLDEVYLPEVYWNWMAIQSFADTEVETFFVEGFPPKRAGWSGVAKVVKRKLDMH